MKPKYKRMQEKEWQQMKDNLKLIDIKQNLNEQIIGYYISIDGKKFTHCLSDIEFFELLNNSIIPSDKFYLKLGKKMN